MNRRLSTLSGRACVSCQKRKSRCTPISSQAGVGCSYCARTGKLCSFEAPPDRTPLTRKNLDAAEDRSAQLYQLVKLLSPDLNIEAALQGLSKRREGESYRVEDEDEAGSDFEWHEASFETDAGQDGMAMLSTFKAGYLGSSSGSNLLQEISTLLPSTTSPATSSGSPGQVAKALSSGLDPPELASATITSLLIDAYFLYYNTSYPILHERTFRDKAANRHDSMAKSSPTWRIIFYMVLAIGHWTSTAQSTWEYYTAARLRLSMSMLESGTAEMVQAFLLMGNYLQKRDRPNTGYNFIGIAQRLALGLGLHREMAKPQEDIVGERRRQLFWVLFCFDSGFNITTGRPSILAEGFIDIRLPLNIDDRDCVGTDPVPAQVSYPTPYSAIIAQSRLARLASAIYTEFLLAKTANAKMEYQVADAMEQKLTDWERTLPHYFTSIDVPSWFHGPRSVVLWKAQNLRILLWRGSKSHHSFLPGKPSAQQRCAEIAMQSIHDIFSFCTAFEGTLHMGINWYATYFLFQATLVLEAGLFNDDPGDAGGPYQVSVSKARSCLQQLAPNNASASRCLEVLMHVHNHFAPESAESAAPCVAPPQPHPKYRVPALPPNQNVPLNFAAYPAPQDMHYTNGTGFGTGFGLSDFTPDPTLRMLVDQMPLDFPDNAPLDFLFNNETIDYRYHL